MSRLDGNQIAGASTATPGQHHLHNLDGRRDKLVSPRYKFIHLKTAKTAGTSVESYFERFCVPEGAVMPETHTRGEYVSPAGIVGYRGPMRNPKESHKWWHHMPAWQIRQQIGEQIWNDYFKFCVVRNPFDKAISAFEHFGKDHAATGRLWWLRPKYLGYNSEQFRFLHWVKRGLPIDRDKYVIDSKFAWMLLSVSRH